MNLFEQAVSASNNIELSKINITHEIINKCAKYVSSQQFEDYIKGRLVGETLGKREMTIYVSYWAYHSGCSGTQFRCGNWVWKNPDENEYSYASHRYKGIELLDIHVKVVKEMCNLVKAQMQEFGFANIFIDGKMNNLGYAEYEVVIRW